MPLMKSFVRYDVVHGVKLEEEGSKKTNDNTAKTIAGRESHRELQFESGIWGSLQMKEKQLDVLLFELSVLLCQSLWCEPVFALPEEVFKCSVVPTGTFLEEEKGEKKGDMNAADVEAKKRKKKRNDGRETERETVFCLYQFREHRYNEHGCDGDRDVLLHLPYRVQPKPCRTAG